MASSPLEASNASSCGQEVPGHAATAPTSDERKLRVWDAGLPPLVPSGSGLNFEATMLYTSWEQVPLFPPREMKVRPVFLEFFAGKAWLTKAMQKKGWLVLPPIDIVVDGEVRFPTDILDPLVMEKLRNWSSSGVLALVHFGTPCTTFSRARKYGDNGPDPIRSKEFLFGIPGISAHDAEKVRFGTLFLDITIELAKLVAGHGGHWSIENPLSSMMWIMPQMIQLMTGQFRNELDMCAYAGLSKKPT